MGEMDEFSNAIEVVEQFVREHPDTLMVITADHNTGGLSIGVDGNYNWNPEILRNISASTDTLALAAISGEQWQADLARGLGFELNEEEIAKLTVARMQGLETIAVAIRHVIDKRTDTGWTTDGHTGTDVQVFAAGPASELFNGHQDNTDIANKIFSLLPKPKKPKS